jgi:hypothetical protein
MPWNPQNKLFRNAFDAATSLKKLVRCDGQMNFCI